jgi:ABC-type phosphate/phosphonate transport system substrate-binding protein
VSISGDQSVHQRFALLPMYDFPELRGAHDALWSAIAARLRRVSLDMVPERLTRSEGPSALWRDPCLLLGQTCGYPLMTDLTGRVRLVATPVYRAPGCQGAFHRSVIVVGADDPVADLNGLRGRRCAINSWDSNTGMNLLRAVVAPFAEGASFFKDIAVSGSHRQSLCLVAAGAADVAAIDCVTLEHMARIDPELVARTRILAWSPLSPGLPLISSMTTGEAWIDALGNALADVAIDPNLAAIREELLLDGFEVLPAETYTSVLSFEAEAVAQGYPRLA